jgi:hypothetical protein
MLHYCEGNIWFDSHVGDNFLCMSSATPSKACTICACFLHENSGLFLFPVSLFIYFDYGY